MQRAGRFAYFNPAACRLFGASRPEDLLGKEFMDRMAPEYRDVIRERIRFQRETDKPAPLMEQEYLRQDGSRVPVETTAVFIRYQGAESHMVFVRDITERKRAEETLRESRDRLQHLSRRLLEVQEEERRHLARELHDEFGQLLATITLHLHAAKGLAGEVARASLEECMALLQRAGEQVRGLALDLRPTMLESSGLDATLRWLAEQHQRRTGIDVEVVGHSNGVSGEVAIACFRVAQEALTNVVRHARAQHVWLELSKSESTLELVVRDDGVGFDATRTGERVPQSAHLGLLGMNERVQILGGSLEVNSQPGRGTRIRASFPLVAAAAGAAEPTE